MGRRVLPARWGQLLEQWVGLELVRWARMAGPAVRMRFWRDPDGPEVDWAIDRDGRYTPIEIKRSESPRSDPRRLVRASDTKHHQNPGE